MSTDVREDLFKVVSVWGGEMYSFVIDPPLRVTYEEGKRATGWKGTPVLAFDTLEAAKGMAKGYAHAQVWRVRAGEVRELVCGHEDAIWVPAMVEDTGISLARIARFWQEWRDKAIFSDQLSVRSVPDGTVACDWIELVERVQ